MRHGTRWTRRLAVGIVAGLASLAAPTVAPSPVSTALAGSTLGLSPETTIELPGATVTARAVRLDPPTSNGSTCSTVNVIGDSMLAASINTWRDTFDQAGVTANFLAFSGAPAESLGPVFVEQLRASRGDAPCWIVVMGSNDLAPIWEIGGTAPTGEPCNSSAARRAETDRRVHLVNDTIGAHHRIFWMNVFHGWLPDMTCIWNGQLERIDIGVIDWYGSFSRHPEWSLDGVHSDATGDAARATLALNAVR